MASRTKGSFERVGECLYRYTSTGVYFALFKQDGRQIRRSLKTTDKALARRALAQLRQAPGPADAEVRRRSLRFYADLYLQTCAWQKKRSLDQKRQLHADLLRDWPGGPDVSADRLTAAQGQQWMANYARFGSTWNNLHRAFLVSVLKMAMEDHVVTENIGLAVARRRKKIPVRETPSLEEFERILVDMRAHALRDRDREAVDFAEFLGRAGLGNIEAYSLNWGDVDWQAGRIHVFRHKTSTPFDIPIYPGLRELLERLRQKHTLERGISPKREQPILRVQTARGSLQAACKRLGMPFYSHRALRRMFITLALQRGVDVKTIASWQGHRDGGKLILDTYSHVVAGHSDLMAQRMI